MRPCRGFPRSMEGRKETRFEVVPLYADISWEEPVLQKEGRGGALHRARDERTKRGREGGGRRVGEGEESQFSNGPGESGGLYHIYWPTLPSYRPHPRHPPSAATNCPVTTPRTGRPAGRPAAAAPRHRRDPLNDTRPPALPSPTPPNRARASPLLDKIMSRWRAHLGRNSSTRPGRGSLDNRASVDARVIRVWFQISGINIVGSYFFFFLYWRDRSRKMVQMKSWGRKRF